MNARRLRLAASLLAASVLSGCPAGSDERPDPPVLRSVEPRVAIRNQPITLVVTGERFGDETPAEVADAPTLTVARTRDLEGNAVSGPSDSVAVPVEVVDGLDTVAVGLTFGDDAPPGLYGVQVQRAGDRSTVSFPDALALLVPGAATGVDPGAVCAAAPALGIAITGTDLLVVDGGKPTVTLTDGLPSWEYDAFTAALDATPSGCRRVPFDRADVQLCTRLDATIPANARAKAYDLVVAQPPPAGTLSPSRVRFVVDRPFPLAPFPQVRAAVDAPLELTILDPYLSPESRRFHLAQGVPPVVLVDGEPVAFAPSGCVPTGVVGHELCAWLQVTVPMGFPVGPHTITATSMEGCSGTTAFALGGRPVVESIAPTFTCRRDGNTRVAIHGSGFLDPRVLVAGHEVPMSFTCPPGNGSTPCTDIAIYGGTALNLGPGTYDLTVVNGTVPPVASTTSAPLTVAPGPMYVGGPDLTHVYAGIESRVSFPVGAVTGSVRSAELVPAFGGDPVPAAVAPSAAEVTVTVPAGVAESPWKVVLHDDSPCSATSDGWLYTHADYVLWRSGFDEPSLYVVRDDGTSAPADHLASGGNPGGAMSHSDVAGGPLWYFAGSWGWPGADVGGVRFDLRATGDGSPLSGPGFSISGASMTLERDLESVPVDAWRSYLVPFDDPTGWTRREADGATAAATLDDLRAVTADLGYFRIRGRWTAGAGDAAIDNLSIELRH